jgi:hypothetical protein
MKGNIVWLYVVTLGILWFAPVGGRAADGVEPSVGGPESASIEALRHEVETLKQTVRRLEAVLSEMEKHQSDPNASHAAEAKTPVGQTATETSPAAMAPAALPSASDPDVRTVKGSGSSTPSPERPAVKEPVEAPAAVAAGTQPSGEKNNDSPSVRQQWRSIERRMSTEEIEALLGPPQQKFTVGGNTVWYYRYPENKRGSVTFSGDMRVSGWQKPPFGLF